MAACEPLASQREKLSKYHTSLWGDFFLTHKPCSSSQYLSMKDWAEVKKEEVRQMILNSSSADQLVKLELIDTLQRLGLDYHYGKEIDNLLCSINDSPDERCDLHTTALRFYLLRKHGYYVSLDVFLRFIDDKGNIAVYDSRSMLTMYNAAHLRIHGEKILDKAISFIKSHLQSTAKHLHSPLSEEVLYALETPLFRRVKRVETKHYISIYEKMTTRNESILELAKLDFNILQALYCDELKTLTLWSKELQVQTHINFARDRIVELHFWILGILFEPQYSYARVTFTKLLKFASIFDDFYDTYSTSEESKMFTIAMTRWDEQATEELPEYIKSFYNYILTTVKAIEEDLKLHKNKHLGYIKRVLIDLAKCYNAEVKWRDEGYVPASVEEHLQISIPSAACMHIACLSFVSMGDMATSEAIDWVFTYPNIIKAFSIIARVGNDIMSHKREQESMHVASTVEACMKENDITIEQAYKKLKELIEESWIDIAKECLKPTIQPMSLLERVVNGARTMDFFYKCEDAYTLSYSLKDILASLYVDPMLI